MKNLCKIRQKAWPNLHTVIQGQVIKPLGKRVKHWSYFRRHWWFPNNRTMWHIKDRTTSHLLFPRHLLNNTIVPHVLNGIIVPRFQHRVSPQLLTEMAQTRARQFLIVKKIITKPLFPWQRHLIPIIDHLDLFLKFQQCRITWYRLLMSGNSHRV